ncbi:DUF2304 domain-containing protein [Parolsenella catena]|uniref:DUF2304 domain-containing protein n=1 Tax=Parolsenella catena TaxID=2003188 RepID=UPI00189B985F|nr:DUF2304 domain-containing protein [Parolsenella catena]
MTGNLRIFLLIGAALLLVLVARKIKKSQFDTHDTFFWLGLSVLLILAAAFPQLVYVIADLLGFQSASNFVFLAVIAILLWRLFRLQENVVTLRRKLTTLVQEIALKDIK